MLGGERLHMLHEGQGPARKDRPRTSQKGTVCTWCARRAASSAYVSTNSGEEERRDEIMGPTASRTRSGRLLCPGISDFEGHRVLGAGAQDPGDRKPLWPPPSPIIATFTPTFSALDPASLYSAPSQGNLICHIALRFKTAVEITGHFFPS